MKEEEKIICDFMSDFTEKNWDKIDPAKIELKESKEELISEIKRDVQVALWVLDEVCTRAMDKKYLQELFVKEIVEVGAPFRVIKIGDKYIKIQWKRDPYRYEVGFTEPKTKTVTYFE